MGVSECWGKKDGTTEITKNTEEKEEGITETLCFCLYSVISVCSVVAFQVVNESTFRCPFTGNLTQGALPIVDRP